MNIRYLKKFKLNPEQIEFLQTGQYAQKQLLSPSRIVRFSHGSRFLYAKNIVERSCPDTLVDYGCGDGTFLLLIDALVKSKIGFDVDPQQIESCIKRYSNKKDVSFNLVSEFTNYPDSSVNFISCMEVLEHCDENEIERILQLFQSKLSEDGKLLISVPLEIGWTFLFKHTMRKILGFFKVGQYQFAEKVQWSEVFNTFFASKDTVLKRNFEQISIGGISYKSCGHMGFNWKHFQKILEKYFTIEEISFTPVKFLGGILNGQVWFTCQSILKR